MIRCDDCREDEYACDQCDEQAYMWAGQRELENEMRARVSKVMRR